MFGKDGGPLRPRTGRRRSNNVQRPDEDGNAVKADGKAKGDVSPPPEQRRKSSTFGQLRNSFRSNSSDKAAKQKEKKEEKEKEKEKKPEGNRPWSSLLKRPGSRSGSRERRASKGNIQPEGPEVVELPPTQEPAKRPPTASVQKKMGNWGDGDMNDRPVMERPGTASRDRGVSLSKRGIRPPSAMGRPVGADATVDIGGGDNRANSPDIPQMIEVMAQEFGSDVAKAPNVAVNRVASYRELDNQLLRHPAFKAFDGQFDVATLIRFLSPEFEVREEDTAWTWDYLFTSVTSDLRERWVAEPEDDPLAQSFSSNIAP